MEQTSFFERFSQWVRKSVTLKIFIIGILILVLLIPSALLGSLINEREQTRNEAIDEVSSKWGNKQTIGGPIISIPFNLKTTDEKGNIVERTDYAHFLPENLKIKGIITPEKRYRGIYVVVLYNVKLKITGTFNKPDFTSLNIQKENILMDKAFVSLGVSDMKGIKENVNIKWNDSLLSCNPGITNHDIFSSGLSAPISLNSKSINFSCELNLNGSSDLSFLPFGKETLVDLQSTWSNPSFTGSFLPEKRNVTENGFNAYWKVLHLNRNYPQQGIGNFVGTVPDYNQKINYPVQRDNYSANTNGDEASFGVKLLLPIDEYQKTSRSAKYNIVFICLTFLAFFFVEVLNKKRIHPIQYLIVGFAISLFYILLLSISEHLSFDLAYLIGCIIILILVTFYAKAIFKNNKIMLMISGMLAILYGFFYSLLQLQDYALLLGSIGLLLILGVIMYLTRNIDWYQIEE